MQSDARQLLYDIATATQAIRGFTHGRTRRDYENDLMLRSACERQLEMLGKPCRVSATGIKTCLTR